MGDIWGNLAQGFNTVVNDISNVVAPVTTAVTTAVSPFFTNVSNAASSFGSTVGGAASGAVSGAQSAFSNWVNSAGQTGGNVLASVFAPVAGSIATSGYNAGQFSLANQLNASTQSPTNLNKTQAFAAPQKFNTTNPFLGTAQLIGGTAYNALSSLGSNAMNAVAPIISPLSNSLFNTKTSPVATIASAAAPELGVVRGLGVGGLGALGLSGLVNNAQPATPTPVTTPTGAVATPSQPQGTIDPFTGMYIPGGIENVSATANAATKGGQVYVVGGNIYNASGAPVQKQYTTYNVPSSAQTPTTQPYITNIPRTQTLQIFSPNSAAGLVQNIVKGGGMVGPTLLAQAVSEGYVPPSNILVAATDTTTVPSSYTTSMASSLSGNAAPTPLLPQQTLTLNGPFGSVKQIKNAVVGIDATTGEIGVYTKDAWGNYSLTGGVGANGAESGEYSVTLANGNTINLATLSPLANENIAKNPTNYATSPWTITPGGQAALFNLPTYGQTGGSTSTPAPGTLTSPLPTGYGTVATPTIPVTGTGGLSEAVAANPQYGVTNPALGPASAVANPITAPTSATTQASGQGLLNNILAVGSTLPVVGQGIQLAENIAGYKGGIPGIVPAVGATPVVGGSSPFVAGSNMNTVGPASATPSGGNLISNIVTAAEGIPLIGSEIAAAKGITNLAATGSPIGGGILNAVDAVVGLPSMVGLSKWTPGADFMTATGQSGSAALTNFNKQMATIQANQPQTDALVAKINQEQTDYTNLLQGKTNAQGQFTGSADEYAKAKILYNSIQSDTATLNTYQDQVNKVLQSGYQSGAIIPTVDGGYQIAPQAQRQYGSFSDWSASVQKLLTGITPNQFVAYESTPAFANASPLAQIGEGVVKTITNPQELESSAVQGAALYGLTAGVGAGLGALAGTTEAGAGSAGLLSRGASGALRILNSPITQYGTGALFLGGGINSAAGGFSLGGPYGLTPNVGESKFASNIGSLGGNLLAMGGGALGAGYLTNSLLGFGARATTTQGGGAGPRAGVYNPDIVFGEGSVAEGHPLTETQYTLTRRLAEGDITNEQFDKAMSALQRRSGNVSTTPAPSVFTRATTGVSDILNGVREAVVPSVSAEPVKTGATTAITLPEESATVGGGIVTSSSTLPKIGSVSPEAAFREQFYGIQPATESELAAYIQPTKVPATESQVITSGTQVPIRFEDMTPDQIKEWQQTGRVPTTSRNIAQQPLTQPTGGIYDITSENFTPRDTTPKMEFTSSVQPNDITKAVAVVPNIKTTRGLGFDVTRTDVINPGYGQSILGSVKNTAYTIGDTGAVSAIGNIKLYKLSPDQILAETGEYPENYGSISSSRVKANIEETINYDVDTIAQRVNDIVYGKRNIKPTTNVFSPVADIEGGKAKISSEINPSPERDVLSLSKLFEGELPTVNLKPKPVAPDITGAVESIEVGTRESSPLTYGSPGSEIRSALSIERASNAQAYDLATGGVEGADVASILGEKEYTGGELAEVPLQVKRGVPRLGNVEEFLKTGAELEAKSRRLPEIGTESKIEGIGSKQIVTKDFIWGDVTQKIRNISMGDISDAYDEAAHELEDKVTPKSSLDIRRAKEIARASKEAYNKKISKSYELGLPESPSENILENFRKNFPEVEERTRPTTSINKKKFVEPKGAGGEAGKGRIVQKSKVVNENPLNKIYNELKNIPETKEEPKAKSKSVEKSEQKSSTISESSLGIRSPQGSVSINDLAPDNSNLAPGSNPMGVSWFRRPQRFVEEEEEQLYRGNIPGVKKPKSGGLISPRIGTLISPKVTKILGVSIGQTTRTGVGTSLSRATSQRSDISRINDALRDIGRTSATDQMKIAEQKKTGDQDYVREFDWIRDVVPKTDVTQKTETNQKVVPKTDIVTLPKITQPPDYVPEEKPKIPPPVIPLPPPLPGLGGPGGGTGSTQFGGGKRYREIWSGINYNPINTASGEKYVNTGKSSSLGINLPKIGGGGLIAPKKSVIQSTNPSKKIKSTTPASAKSPASKKGSTSSLPSSLNIGSSMPKKKKKQ